MKLLKLMVAAFAVSTMMPAAAIADPSEPTEPPPQMCGCEWIAIGSDGSYGWVCSNPPKCQHWDPGS
jgi:hypothetical protein